MNYSETHWKIVDFFARRVLAVGFVVAGSILAIFGVQYILPGGTVLLNGIPSDDLVFRWASFLLPILMVACGIALFKVAPFVPPKK